MPWLVLDGISYSLKAGQLTLGRSPKCDLVVSDALASRHHATFLLAGDQVTIQDKGSRNGTLINGAILVGSKTLSHLDRVLVGSSQIVFYDSLPRDAELTPIFSAAPPEQLEETDVSVGSDDTQATNTHTGSGHVVLGSLIAKSLDSHDLKTAGRIIENLAHRIMLGVNEGSLPADELSACSDVIMRFADVTKDARWIEWLLEVHARTRQVPSRYATDIICSLGDRMTSPATIRRWLTVVKARELNPEQRFLVSRVEGLERQLSA